MSNLYKYGFWLVLLAIFTLFNVYRITKENFNKEKDVLIRLNEKRVEDLITSCIVRNRKIKAQINGKNILTKEISKNLLKDKSIVILLSDFECSKCQEMELKRLDSLKNILNPYGIFVVGITIKSKKDITIRQRKIANIKLPIYWVDNKTFFNKLSFSDKFPQILYIADSIIVSAFIPLAQDNEFSNKYYKKLIPFIIKHN